jgi:hypothetical protein
MDKGRWASRVTRGLRPDSNPLRRTLDRVEAFIFGALLVAAVVAAPLAAILASHWGYTSALRAGRLQRETSHQVRAVLQASTPAPASGYPATSRLPAAVRWANPDGSRHTGTIAVPPGSRAGQAFWIWTDASGGVARPPLTTQQAAAQGVFTAIIAVVLTLVTAVTAAGTTRWLMNRRRIAAWDADWAVTAPMWTPQSW